MSSLSSVVSALVRASMGSSVSSTVTDDDLDRHVAELILKEAKQKAERYGKQGVRAYLPEISSNAPRANKRFLSSIIRSTDDHNRTILQAQALAAQEIKREREELERRERWARAREATDAERRRRTSAQWEDDDVWSTGGVSRTRKRRDRSHDWRVASDGDDHDDDERRSDSGTDGDSRKKRRRRSHHRSRSRRRSHSRERRSRHGRSHRDRSRSSRKRRREGSLSREREDDARPRHTDRARDHRRRSDRHHHRHRRRSVSSERRSHSSDSGCRAKTDSGERTPPRSRHSRAHRSPQSSDAEPDNAEREAELRSTTKGKSKSKSKCPFPEESSTANSRQSATPEPNVIDSTRPLPATTQPPSSSSPIQLPSKMDKYFHDSYDPRLDVAPLSLPKVPAAGLVDNAEFEGWDAMLELIRLRREDKEEKKRMERLGLSTTHKKSGGTFQADGTAGSGNSIMDIQYKKRGSVREWDLGKEPL